MTAGRRHSTAVFAVLALLVWVPNALFAGCGPCPLMASAAVSGRSLAPPCCPRHERPSFRPVDCCGKARSTAPAPASRAVAPPVSPPLASPSLAETAPEPPVVAAPPPSPSPPPLYRRDGLYTLHATFLI